MSWLECVCVCVCVCVCACVRACVRALQMASVVRRESSRVDRDRRIHHHQLEVRHSADYGPDSDRPAGPPTYKRATRESFLI